ncbi:hypothetical protein [Zobellia uliginosa]|uniref:hypothetical protein n=1 Tax=Zobellia uliginosa TaxID=143224 RepID=UPI0026E306A4|nr:hypothetical protein [Zobellia uliginosa]MDO6515847.1 hypothetical protein [Zobellia uliginosa]
MRIKNLSLLYRDLIHEVNLDLGLYIESINVNKVESSVLRNYNHGISWKYQTVEKDLLEIKLMEKEKRILAYPSPDMKYMVVLFDRNSQYHPHPNNLVVFYANGEEKQVVKVPELISDRAIKNSNNPFGVDKEGSFENIWWHKKENEKKMAVDIHFAWENTETREFDPETGQFGSLISVSGRF